MQRNIKPGTFETITNVSIGTFTQNVVTNFKLDGNYPFLLSDIVIKQGATIISASNYTLSIDTAATTQESGQTGKILHGAIKITNPTYAGVELNVSGSNFGSYVSNEGTVDYITEQIATKTSATGANIEEGEIARFVGTGQNIESDNSGAVAPWLVGSIYNTKGTLVRREGTTYVATGKTTNQGLDPSLPNNAAYWYEADSATELKKYANVCKILGGDLHLVHNRADGDYTTSLRVGKTKVGSTTYEFHEINLDGSTVTGNATLTALLAGNPYLDLIAPDSLGTRTLIDMSSRHAVPMSVGGDNDVLGGVLEDRFQGHWHLITNGGGEGLFVPGVGASGYIASIGNRNLSDLFTSRATSTDNINGTPRTGSTTRPKEFITGTSRIIVMVSA